MKCAPPALALGLLATSAHSARYCTHVYSSDDCSGDPTTPVGSMLDATCYTRGWPNSTITMCSPDFQSIQFWQYAGDDCDLSGAAGSSSAYGIPKCTSYPGSTIRGWCSTTDDCSDEPSNTPVIRAGSRPPPMISN